MRARRLLALIASCAGPIAVAGEAGPPTLALSVDGAAYAAVPFTLTLTAKGFEEQPTPVPPPLAIDGCEVAYLGVSPSISEQIVISGGQTSSWREVSFNYRWRIVAPAAGQYALPKLRIEQNGAVAEHAPASLTVQDVGEGSTTDMLVRMRLPERPVWVGETFDVELEWLLTRDAQRQEFSVPLFAAEGARVEAGVAGGRTLAFAHGNGQIQLPYRQDEVRENGRNYSRFVFPARVTLAEPGSLALDPVQVLAWLRTGGGRGFFSTGTYEPVRAEGERQRLTVRALPQAGRPDSFAGAVGGGFALDVQASRTVVAVGEPIELALRLRSRAPLTGVGLPPLGLPSDYFSVPEGGVAGVLEEDGKRFDVTVRVKSAEASEIPPIAFSYFDPASGEYRTVQSQAIALSVEGSQLVGAADVVAAPRTASQASTAPVAAASSAAVNTLIGADMSLSAEAHTLRSPWGPTGAALGAFVGLLYGLPVLIALGAWWLSRTGGARQRNRALREALRAVERALDSPLPARQAAPAVVAALRRLAVAAGADRAAAGTAIEQLETSAFDPAASEAALDEGLVAEVRAVAERWSKSAGGDAKVVAGGASARPATALTMLLGLAVGLAAAAVASAQASDGEAADAAAVLDELGGSVQAEDAPTAGPAALAGAREQYRLALAETDRLRRVRAFAAAERAYRPLAALHPDAAELQADWGNAALGAGDAGRATLAYRRALASDPDNARAAANAEWLRARLPSWLPRPASGGALASLLFWQGRFTAAQLHMVAAAAFAAGLLLVAPWPGGRRWRRPVAVPMFVIWVAAAATALAGNSGEADAVVLVDGAVLRSADSPGASPAFANPLPAGTEVAIVEAREGWLRITLADGTRGWLPRSGVERV